MQHQVGDRDVSLGRPGPGLTVRTETVQHTDLGNFRHIFFGRIGKADLALFDQLHDRNAGDRLGGREDRHHRIQGHRIVLAQFPKTRCTFVNIVVSIGRHRDNTRCAPGASCGFREDLVGDAIQACSHVSLLLVDSFQDDRNPPCTSFKPRGNISRTRLGQPTTGGLGLPRRPA